MANDVQKLTKEIFRNANAKKGNFYNYLMKCAGDAAAAVFVLFCF